MSEVELLAGCLNKDAVALYEDNVDLSLASAAWGSRELIGLMLYAQAQKLRSRGNVFVWINSKSKQSKYLMLKRIRRLGERKTFRLHKRTGHPCRQSCTNMFRVKRHAGDLLSGLPVTTTTCYSVHADVPGVKN